MPTEPTPSASSSSASTATTAITDKQAILTVYPQLAVNRDFLVNPDGSLKQWVVKNPKFPQLTTAQLNAAKAQIAAKMATLTALKTGLATQVARLTAGEAALFSGVTAAVTQALAHGNLALAKTIIQTAPAPSANLQSVQANMLALFSASSGSSASSSSASS